MSALAADTRELVAQALEVVRPRPTPRPSEWVRRIVITPEESPDAPGPYDPGYLPWLTAILDLEHDHPTKRGAVIRKRSQVGLSLAMLAVQAYAADAFDGPQLYTIADANEATSFAHSRFRPLVAGVPELAESFRQGAEGARDLMAELHHARGRIDFAGGGSASKYSTRPYRRIIADEWENISANFPVGRFGNPHNFLLGRMGSFTLGTWFVALGHPTLAGRGIDELYETESDRGAWVFDCPSCSAPVFPTWAGCVRFTEQDHLGRDLARSAVFCCPSCGAEITDAERRRAVWPKSERHPDGSGRLLSPLDPDEAAGRPYVGVHVSGLVDPRRSLAEFAREWCNCNTDEQRQAFLNTRMGEAFSPTRTTITSADLDEATTEAATGASGLPRIPGGREHGCRLLVAGVDVQRPDDSPTFYLWVRGYAPGGVVYSVAMPTIAGVGSWDALERWAMTYRVEVTDDDGTPVGTVGLSGIGIDNGDMTRMVNDWARRPIVNPDGRGVKVLPVRFSAKLDGDRPWLPVPASKCIDPDRPHLGPIEAYYLHRHTAIGRELSTIAQGRVVFAHELRTEHRAHLLSQVEAPLKKQHSHEAERFEWTRAKGHRDDWLTAGAYASAVASISLYLGRLDELPSLAEIATPLPGARRPGPRAGTPQGRPPAPAPDGYGGAGYGGGFGGGGGGGGGGYGGGFG